MGILAPIQMKSLSVAESLPTRCHGVRIRLRIFLLVAALVGPYNALASPARSEIRPQAGHKSLGRGTPVELRKGEVHSGGRAQALLRWQGVSALVDQQELKFDFVDTQLRPLRGSLPYYQASLDRQGRRLLLSFPGLGSAVDESTFRREVARLKLVGVPWQAAGIRVDPADSTLVIWLELADSQVRGRNNPQEASLKLMEMDSSLRIAWTTENSSESKSTAIKASLPHDEAPSQSKERP